MARTVVIASGKGGVGKTTVTANLGILLAMTGKRVILADADIGLNNLDVALCIESRVVYDVVDVAEGRAGLRDALVKDKFVPTLSVLPSAKANSSDRVKAAAFAGIIAEASAMADFVIIDAPAGVEAGFHRAVSAAREAIVVTTPHVSAIRDADRTVSLLSTYNVSRIGLVVNRVRGDLVNKGETVPPEKIAELLRLPLYGVIPESDAIGVYTVLNSYGREGAAEAFRLLAEYVTGSGREVYDYTRRYRGFFGRLKRY